MEGVSWEGGEELTPVGEGAFAFGFAGDEWMVKVHPWIQEHSPEVEQFY